MSEYTYRISLTGWGIWVRIQAHLESFDKKTDDIENDEGKQRLHRVSTNRKEGYKLWLQLQCEFPVLDSEEVGYLVLGLSKVENQILAGQETDIVVVVTEVSLVLTEYQAEGLACAMMGWASNHLGFPPVEVPVQVDKTAHRYVFDL